MWAIVFVKADGSEDIRGYMNIYVDDVLYVGLEEDILLVQGVAHFGVEGLGPYMGLRR